LIAARRLPLAAAGSQRRQRPIRHLGIMSAAQMKLAHQVSGPAEVSKHMVFDPSAEVGANHQATSAAHAADAAGEELRSALSQSELPREQLLQEIFEHFDEDCSGALDYTQAKRVFQQLNAEVTLSQEEWRELCESLGVEPAAGLPRGVSSFDTFFEGMDAGNIRSIHSSVTSRVMTGNTADAGGAAGGGAAGGSGGGDGGGAKRESEEEKTARLRASRALRNSSACSPGM
jgi:hypothetical protein